MSVLYLLVPLALVVVGLAVAGWAWSVRTGQFDDLDTPASRMLHDDEAAVGAPPDDHSQSRPRNRS